VSCIFDIVKLFYLTYSTGEVRHIVPRRWIYRARKKPERRRVKVLSRRMELEVVVQKSITRTRGGILATAMTELLFTRSVDVNHRLPILMDLKGIHHQHP
jgi:hypothetical protein